MENQHRKITGYRELEQTEIDLMNEVKALGPQIERLLMQVEAHTAANRQLVVEAGDADKRQQLADRLNNATPERFAALAKTEFQTGLMYLTRAVAQPEFF